MSWGRQKVKRHPARRITFGSTPFIGRGDIIFRESPKAPISPIVTQLMARARRSYRNGPASLHEWNQSVAVIRSGEIPAPGAAGRRRPRRIPAPPNACIVGVAGHPGRSLQEYQI
ncbi:hypothetical protein Zmor_008477 [Zophobas morio]|uniref:Uncharacterized protein n=1 Tax=Zophobas morio TaxID=2755281 RepID=A0AA38MN09_9CUCU|nr:hypothetical protein Zmor_008477 [Zophobas morio]